MKFIADSIQGIKRHENQDNFSVMETPKYTLYALFDGVGSAANGKKATDLAVEFLNNNHQHYTQMNRNLAKMMFDCNVYILSKRLKEPLTTYCLVYKAVSHQTIIYSHLGDSRIYSITPQYIEQISDDYSSAFGNNIITKCLGMSLEKSEFRVHHIELENNSILMCTDGFYRIMEENRLNFFEVFRKRNGKIIQGQLDQLIRGRNNDDSTYIYIP